MDKKETASIQRDAVGNIIVDENGFVSCVSEGIKINYLNMIEKLTKN